jgi:molecular chaperone HtpG
MLCFWLKISHFVRNNRSGMSFEKRMCVFIKIKIDTLMERGSISVQTENIFPIIKKFLYSDHEIFLRELVSNAVDATTKLRTLASRGEVAGEIGDTSIEVAIDKKTNTITITDKGIGMTEEEILKYLNQIAFSSAAEWLEKYKQDANLIGQFGLGFYSSFMVATKVEVRTKSWRENSQPVMWTCMGTPEYTIEYIDKPTRGTEVVLYVGDDSVEFLEDSRIEGLLLKYCRFLPVPIKFGTRTASVHDEDGEGKAETNVEADNIINNVAPAWKKSPAELTDEDYKNFYHELYPMSADPMFWIHLNIDYPFNLTGILYFPKLKNALELQKNKIHLYCNQVYVTDEVKEIVPEWLTLLHGVIDSPDIPLNVSRSYLQGDSNVKKITGYITKKVGEKLSDLFKSDRKAFESRWTDIGVFVKYGMISDEKFAEKAQSFLLLKNTAGDFFTQEEYLSKIKPAQTDKNSKVVLLYTNLPKEHDSYIHTATNAGYDVLELDTLIDNHFMQHLEYKNSDLVFKRVDADTIDHLIPKDEKRESVMSEKEETLVKSTFTLMLGDNNEADVQVKPLSPQEAPVQITRPEFMRRMKEMQSFSGMGWGEAPDFYQVVVNANHPLIAQQMVNMETEDDRRSLARYLYDLALLNQNMLKGPELTAFIQKAISLAK